MNVIKRFKILFAAAACVCLMAGSLVPALARELPDEERECSVTVELSYDNEAITDGSLAVYLVGNVTQDNGNDVFVLTDEFSSFEGSLDDIEDETLAAELYEYIEEYGISPLYEKDNESGQVVFDGLSIGLYLVVQTEASTGYETLSPFLVSVPVYDELEGIYVYDVSAYGKFVLTNVPYVPEDTDVPDDETDEEEETDEETAEEETSQDEADEETDEEPGESTGKLPQTGQLNWPIPVLACAGLLLILLGWSITGAPDGRREDAA